MATLTLRTVKGLPLTNAEVDANFTNLLVAIGGVNGSPYTVPTPTGTGGPVLTTSPTLVTPILGVATATSINKVSITAPASGSTLTIAEGKTLTVSNTLTFTGTDTSTVNFPGGGTVVYSGGALGTPSSGTLTNCTLPVGGVSGLGTGVATFLGTPSSANLLAAITDETGTGSLVFSTSPTFTGTVGVATINATDGIQIAGTTIIDSSKVISGVKTKVIQEIATAVTASTATTTLDLSLGTVFVVTIAANTTFAFSNVPTGTDMTSFTIITVNDATAGRAVSWPASVTWAGGLLPPRTTTASKSDAWSFFTRNAGTTIVGSLSVANY